MKNITEYFNYLYSLERSGMKYDLKNITILLKSLGNPHKNLKFIHVAGTNGKGATASFAASILMEHGLKTGLFTSPHILRFNERIRINGKCISNEYIKCFLTENIKLIKKVKPSFFEVSTALALKYFSDKKADAVVAEAGLGGRLDSTNIIIPEVSVITQIGIDHIQFLGGTIRKIALEKIGIVKPGIDVIVSDNNKILKPLFKSRIAKKHLFYIDEFAKTFSVRKSDKGTSFTIKLKSGKPVKLFTTLLGDYQVRNVKTAILAVRKFTKDSVTESEIKKGVRRIKQNTGYFGRLEVIKSKGFKYIFDISHNPDGIKSALNNLKDMKIRTVIFGMMSDKDYKSSVEELQKYFNNIIFTIPNYKRALSPDIMMDYALKNRKKRGRVLYRSENVSDALKTAKNITHKNDYILIIGSFFLVSDAVKILKLQNHFA
jgi:dihydrofolate synthase/folylpolyglutamate synthase